jgi:hypothetical protein
LVDEAINAVHVVDVVFKQNRLDSGFMTLDHTLRRHARTMSMYRTEYYYYPKAHYAWALKINVNELSPAKYGALNTAVEVQEIFEQTYTSVLQHLPFRRTN